MKKNELQPPTYHSVINAKITDAYSDKTRPIVGIAGFPVNFDENGNLARNFPMDSSMQKHCTGINASQYFTMCQPFNTRWEFRRARSVSHFQMWIILPKYADACIRCGQKLSRMPSNANNIKKYRHLELFSPSGPLEFISSNVHGLVPKILSCNQFVFVAVR